MGYVFLIIALLFNASANILMKLGAGAIERTDMSQMAPVEKLLSLASNWQLIL